MLVEKGRDRQLRDVHRTAVRSSASKRAHSIPAARVEPGSPWAGGERYERPLAHSLGCLFVHPSRPVLSSSPVSRVDERGFVDCCYSCVFGVIGLYQESMMFLVDKTAPQTHISSLTLQPPPQQTKARSGNRGLLRQGRHWWPSCLSSTTARFARSVTRQQRCFAWGYSTE